MKKFVVRKFEIHSDKLSEQWQNTRIVMLSDFHNNSYGLDMEAVLEKITELSPDYVMIAGDMYNGDAKCDNKNAEKFLTRLAAKFPVYYGLGNHEYRTMIYPEEYPHKYEEFEKMIKNTGITLLKNETVKLKKGTGTVAVWGLMIDRSFYKKLKRTVMQNDYMEKLLGKPDRKEFNILLAHHPYYFPQYAAWGADLVFSGHLHGGMARIPGIGGVIAPNYRLFPKYDRGRFDEGSSVMILSAGIGTHTVNIRPFNPAEIVAVDLV